MTYENQILLGRISRANVYDGSVTIKIGQQFIENLPEMESVFLEIENKPVPFFISSSEYSGSDILKLKFDGYSTFDKINEFTGCRVFLTVVGKEKLPDSKAGILTGFKVFLKDNEFLGTIVEIISNPGHDLIMVQSSQLKEMLIPLHEDFIVDIDSKKGIIVLDIPDGLKDLN